MILARRPLSLWFAVGLLLSASAANAGDQPPASDTALAETLSQRAVAAEQQGDRREAARWRLRAERWDPSRVADLRLGVAHLESFDRPAALRQSARLLDADLTFGLRDPSLLIRLKGAAIERDTPESFSVAARMTRRLVRWTKARPGLNRSRIADLWREVGELHAAADEATECSEAFDELQRLAVSSEGEIDVASVRWDLIASLHLDAGEVDRAAVAIGLMADAHGDTREVLAGRARVALRMGEPLAAVTHAKGAIEAEPEWGSGPPYEELVAALHGINQDDRSAPMLSAYHADSSDDITLARLLIESLVACGKEEEAWSLSGELLDKCLPDGASESADRRDVDVADATLADAAALRLELAVGAGRYQTVLDLLPRLAAALDSPNDLNEIAKPLLEDKRLVGRLASWCERIASRSVGDPAPLGARRVVVALGTAVGRQSAARACLRLRLEEKIAAGEGVDPVGQELDFWVYEAVLSGNHAAAARQLRWFLEAIRSAYPADDESVQERLGLASLDLAECLIEIADGDREGRQEILGALADAGRLLPDAPGAMASRIYSFYCLGAYDEAIAAGEQFLNKWPRPTPANHVEEYTHRAAVITLANALVARRGAGDVERAVECYEDLLDRWPDDPGVLNSLAYEWASPGAPLARAERMARRAVEIKGDQPDFVDTLGWIVFHRGRYAAAATILADAVALAESGNESSDPSVLREHYAEALRRQGRAEEAESQDAK